MSAIRDFFTTMFAPDANGNFQGVAIVAKLCRRKKADKDASYFEHFYANTIDEAISHSNHIAKNLENDAYYAPALFKDVDKTQRRATVTARRPQARGHSGSTLTSAMPRRRRATATRTLDRMRRGVARFLRRDRPEAPVPGRVLGLWRSRLLAHERVRPARALAHARRASSRR